MKIYKKNFFFNLHISSTQSIFLIKIFTVVSPQNTDMQLNQPTQRGTKQGMKAHKLESKSQVDNLNSKSYQSNNKLNNLLENSCMFVSKKKSGQWGEWTTLVWSVTFLELKRHKPYEGCSPIEFPLMFHFQRLLLRSMRWQTHVQFECATIY